MRFRWKFTEIHAGRFPIHVKLIFSILHPEMRAVFNLALPQRLKNHQLPSSIFAVSRFFFRQVLIEDRRKWVLKLLKCILKLGDCETEATWDKFLWASRQSRRSDEKLGGSATQK